MAFYSGNILIDLFINALFALPALLSGVVHLFLVFANLDPRIAGLVSTFAYVLTALLYLIAIFRLTVGTRTHTAGIV